MHTLSSSSQLLLGKKDALIQSPPSPHHHNLWCSKIYSPYSNFQDCEELWGERAGTLLDNQGAKLLMFECFVDFFHHHSPHHLHVAGLPAGHVGAEARACGHHCQPCWAGRDKQAGKGTVTEFCQKTTLVLASMLSGLSFEHPASVFYPLWLFNWTAC